MSIYTCIVRGGQLRPPLLLNAREVFGYLILEYKKHQITLKSDGSCRLKCSDFNGGTKEFDGTYVLNDNTIDIIFSDEVITLDYINDELSWVLPDSGVRICMRK